MTPLLNILPADCSCGCNNCGGSDGTMGNLSSDLIQAGIAAGGALKGLFSGGSSHGECAPPAGCFNCQIKGQGGIAGCLDDFWLHQLPAMKASVANGQVTKAAFVNVLQQTLSALGNSQLFTPQNEPYLVNTKSGIQGEINAANAEIAAAAAGTTTTGTTAPVVITTGGQSTILGLPLTTILLLAGAGLVGFSLLKAD